jgi:hypothetical protein
VNSVIISDSATADARDDQHLLRGRHAAHRRGQREEDEPGEEETPVPEQVAQPATQEQEAAESEQVGVDDPGQGGLGEAEILPDRRQGNAHDRHVEDDHQVAQAQHEEREPTVASVHRHERRPFRESVFIGVSWG